MGATQSKVTDMTDLFFFLARWVTPIFVAFDIAALLLQLVGAVMIAGSSITDSHYLDKVHKGKWIALAGVSVQILAFGLFSIIAVRFHIVAKRFKADLERRLQSIPGEKYVTVEGIEGRKLRPNWEMLLYAVNISCALIMVSLPATSEPTPRGKRGGEGGSWLFGVKVQESLADCGNFSFFFFRFDPSIVRSNSPRVGPATPTRMSGCK